MLWPGMEAVVAISRLVRLHRLQSPGLAMVLVCCLTVLSFVPPLELSDHISCFTRAYLGSSIRAARKDLLALRAEDMHARVDVSRSWFLSVAIYSARDRTLPLKDLSPFGLLDRRP